MFLSRVKIFIIFFLASVPLFAGQSDYDDCILKHLKGAKQDLAVHAIKQACAENHKDSTFISSKKQQYNQCILENLIGVESIQAVLEIKEACKRKHR